MGQINHPSDLFDMLRDLQRQIDEVRKRVGLSSATISSGGLTVQDGGYVRVLSPAGVETVYAGPYTAAPLADGTPQQALFLRDHNGRLRFSIYDPDPITDGYQPLVWLFSHTGIIMLSSDIYGGMAEPWISVPMHPQFNDTASPDVAGTYRSLPVSGITGSPVVWEGRIGKVSHPRIQIDGIWGVASGTPSVTYAFKVGGTTVGTWTTGAAAGYAVQGPWDISSRIANTNVPVQLTVSVAGGAPTDRVALGMLACWMRQS